ncbi:hypothetical protein IWZ01DRAFT_559816, partial [Phyllosticta capitalensis]
GESEHCCRLRSFVAPCASNCQHHNKRPSPKKHAKTPSPTSHLPAPPLPRQHHPPIHLSSPSSREESATLKIPTNHLHPVAEFRRPKHLVEMPDPRLSPQLLDILPVCEIGEVLVRLVGCRSSGRGALRTLVSCWLFARGLVVLLLYHDLIPPLPPHPHVPAMLPLATSQQLPGNQAWCVVVAAVFVLVVEFATKGSLHLLLGGFRQRRVGVLRRVQGAAGGCVRAGSVADH